MKLTERLIRYYMPPKKKTPPAPSFRVTGCINDDAAALRDLFGRGGDLVMKTMRLRFDEGEREVLAAAIDGLVDKELMSVSVMNPIANFKGSAGGDAFSALRRDVITSGDIKTVATINDAAPLLTSGFVCVFLQGCTSALAVGAQGYAYRSVDEPQTEVLQRGSREGFSEPIKVNQALLRRRLKTEKLCMKPVKIGSTDIAVCYLEGVAPEELVRDVMERLRSAELDAVFTSGCLVEYLDGGAFSFFNGVGVTERTDTAAAKLHEGKVAVIVDGTPSVLTLPHLMVENFSTLDDYSDRPYFAAMTRWLKYTAFAVAVFLPGAYVALASYSPEFFPTQLLTRVATSVSKTPFSVFAEVLLFTFIYEIMREAGQRLPKTLGHAVSIIGGLVIGDTAVNSGFIGAPTLMIVALTVICSYVIPDLYAPIAALRLLFILFGGIWGVWGIMIMLCVMTVDLCSKESFGVPFMLPIAPLNPFGLRDAVIRAPWSVLSRKQFIAEDEIV